MVTKFELSRIYAAGWNAASALSSADRDTLIEKGGIEAVNPWPLANKLEHKRWAEGFGRALGQELKTPFRPGLLSRRPL